MFKKKLKELMDKSGEGNSKRQIENLVVFIIILIVTILILNSILSDKKPSNQDENQTNTKTLATTNQTKDNSFDKNQLETELENILKTIDGVGELNVFINYSETSKTVAMYNENKKESSTEETDKTGGKRTIQETDTQKDVIYTEENGSKTPITEKVVMPTIEGAIITAQGASDANVKTNIVQAVEAVTGISTYKIQVFEMSKD